MFHRGRFCRDISLNAKYLVLLKNARDKKQFSYLAQQVYSENSKRVYEAYLDATARPHGYVLLDFSPDTNDLLRFRTNVLPSEHPPAFYAAVADEEQTDQTKLSRAPSPQIGGPKIT
jgi:hypothetical protein